MNKKLKVTIGIIIGILLLYLIIFFIDYNRCSNMKEPIFVVLKQENDLTLKSITYQGLGYRVEVEKTVSAQYGPFCRNSIRRNDNIYDSRAKRR